MIDETGVLFSGNREGRLVGATFAADQTLALIEDRHTARAWFPSWMPRPASCSMNAFFPESGYVLSVRFTPDSQAFDVVLVNTDGAKVQPLLKRFAINGEASGQRLLDLEGIFPLVIYDQSGQPFCAAIPDWLASVMTARIYGLKSICPGSKRSQKHRWNLLCWRGERLSGKLGIYSLGADGKLSPRTEIGDQVTSLSTAGQYVAFGSGTHVYVYDAVAHQLILDNNLGVEVVRTELADLNTLTVVTASGVRRLSFEHR